MFQLSNAFMCVSVCIIHFYIFNIRTGFQIVQIIGLHFTWLHHTYKLTYSCVYKSDACDWERKKGNRKESRHLSYSWRATSTSSPSWRCTGVGFWCELVGDEETKKLNWESTWLFVYLLLTAAWSLSHYIYSFSLKHTNTHSLNIYYSQFVPRPISSWTSWT